MKRVIVALLAMLCLTASVFAININADPDEDWADRIASKSLIAPPVIKLAASATPLTAGDYYIPQGSNPSGFVSLEAAVDSINANGVDGTVNLLLDADTLRENSFTFNAALDDTNNVTVKPANGRDVVLIVGAGASQGNGDQMIGFNLGYVTFDGSNDGTDSRNLIVTTETDDIRVPFGVNTKDVEEVVIKNLIIKNLDNVTTGFKYGVVSNDVGGNSFTVDNCQIGSPDWPVWRDGVAVWGDWTNGFAEGVVTNNDIHAGARGISTYIAGPCVFAGNNVTLYPTATSYSYNYGIYCSWVSGAEIYDNVVTSAEAATGTGVAKVGGIVTASHPAGAEFTVYNNMISVADAAETVPAYGLLHMSSSNARDWNVYHNTFEVTGTGECYGIGNSSTGPVTMDLKNNIILNDNAGTVASAAIKLVDPTTVLTSNNNILVSAEKLASLGGTDYADLADWKAAGYDANSDSVDVTFAGPADLHLAAPSDTDVNLTAPVIAGIDTDIDGDARGVFFAYAGADEGTAYPASNDLDLTFDDATDVANWSHYDEANGWTVEAQNDGVLVLSDAGYGMLAKRPVSATVGSVYKLTIDIKTSLWAGASNELELSVQGLGADQVAYSCINDTDWVTYNIVGVAEATDGYIRIGGAKAGTVDTVFVDNVVWDDQYMDVVPSANVAELKSNVAIGDDCAASCVLTALTIGAPVFGQDASGGIALYEWDIATDNTLEEGDEILFVGQRAEYNGLQQVKYIDDYVVLSKGNAITPELITVPDLESRDYQGMLVMVEDVDTVDGFSWPTADNSASIDLTDGTNEFTMRIDSDGEMDGAPEPTSWPLDLIGVVGEFYSPQIMPRYMDDFLTNQPPNPFTILNPADNAVITSFDDPEIEHIAMGGDSVYAMFMNWTDADDPEGDSLTYEMLFVGDAPDEAYTTADTFMYVPINEDKPYDMNGMYTYYFSATDPMGEVALSDTHDVTFAFPAPPEITYATSSITDDGNQVYVEFSVDFDSTTAQDPANYMLYDVEASSAAAPTAVSAVAPNAVMLTAAMTEDNHYQVMTSGILDVNGDVATEDTSKAFMNLIPQSDAHPEDVEFTVQDFESGTGNFWAPTGSGSTYGLLTSSTFASSADEAYGGEKSGKLVLLDDPAETGGWYVRLYNQLVTSIPTNSIFMIMVKGHGDVEMRLSVKDSGYEQGPWHKVTLCENDWQVVTFDLVNDVAEGWITGNGTVEGSSVKIEAIHMRSSSDEDVTMYVDEMLSRRPLSPVDITFNVNMKQQVKLEKFNPALDFVDVAGTMNAWDGSGHVLSDDDNDTTYTITFSEMPLQTLNFKFRINGSWDDATCEFPSGGPDREYYVKMSGNTKDFWYDDDTLVVEEAVEGIPTEFALRQNYPNPFNPTTTIQFDIPEMADVKLVVYDVTGRKVRTLVNGNLDAGYKKVVWNGKDAFGNPIATGLYIYRLQAGDYVDVKKMTFLK